MKTLFINALYHSSVPDATEVLILGWVRSKNDLGSIVFLSIVDSTGSIQAVVEKSRVPLEIFEVAKHLHVESSVKLCGHIVSSREGADEKEIVVSSIEIIGDVDIVLSPSPRSSFGIFDENYVDLVLSKRHLYLRNERLMAVMMFRHKLVGILHDWFRQQGFIEFHAPILTPVPLYDDTTAVDLTLFDNQVFLTQCVGFYLESAVHAFEKIYNIGPSFRREESRSRRHLVEYWHVKAELAFSNLDDLMHFAESAIVHVVNRVSLDCKQEFDVVRVSFDGDLFGTTPYPRITYEEAVEELNHRGANIEWGTSISSSEEELLSRDYTTPFWITGIPRLVEPFPYVIDSNDARLTRVADLIAPGGYGELLGVAEKISNIEDLTNRMDEKNKTSERYNWCKELRQFGCVPHGGMGMGLERLMRWLMKLSHVRDAIPFPRQFGRTFYP